MQIKLLGTGSILTKYLSSSALIDNQILLDCPNGIVKSIRKLGIVPTDINVCLITHFHADHFFDIPFLLLEQGLRNVRETEFIIVGPNGLANKINSLFNMAYPEDWGKIKIQSKLKTIEINNSKEKICYEDYTIIPYKVEHIGYDAYGYIVEKRGRRIGFTGDTIICSSVEKIVQSCDLIFADMSFEKNSKGHMGMNDIDLLMNKYNAHNKIIPTHMTDNVRNIFKEKYFAPPFDGDEFIV